jgi:uroporphyrinogen III methyltransferase/synthase
MEKLTLKGRTILVTRARKQASALSDELRLHGAEVIEAPAIRIEPPEDWRPLDEAVETIERYDWILFTSANAVEPFMDRLGLAGRSSADLERIKLAAIGPVTRAALEAQGLRAEVVPERFIAEEVYDALRRHGKLAGRRALLPRADIAREALPELLRKDGMEVDIVVAYRTVPAREEILSGVELVLQDKIDVVTFTSGSTVRSFFSVIDDKDRLRDTFVPASIGPITSQALEAQGFPHGIEAKQYTSQGLALAIVEYYTRSEANIDQGSQP